MQCLETPDAASGGAYTKDYRFRLVPISVEVKHGLIIVANHALNLCILLPCNRRRADHFLDDSVVVSCRELYAQRGEPQSHHCAVDGVSLLSHGATGGIDHH
jgi:hypothetical protein